MQGYKSENRHFIQNQLTHLIVETCGMPANVLAEVCEANLPRLEHLELWLGDDRFGWESSVDDLGPILEGRSFPALRYLGLRNSCIADDIAHAVSGAPIIEQIETLDLSLGTLSDDGARALVEALQRPNLRYLDIHYHYLTDAMVRALRATGVTINAEEQQDNEMYGGEVYRFVAEAE